MAKDSSNSKAAIRWMSWVLSGRAGRPETDNAAAEDADETTDETTDEAADDAAEKAAAAEAETSGARTVMASGSMRKHQPHQQAEHGEQKCGAEKFGIAEDAQLGAEGFDQRDAETGGRQLEQQRRQRGEQPHHAVGVVRHAPGQKQREANADIVEQLETAGPLHQRQMTRGIFEHHGLVDHGEFKVGGGVVHRNARVLG